MSRPLGPAVPSRMPTQCMKKKKLLEMELQNLDTMVMRVVEQRLMLEGQSTTVQVVSGLHKASKRQKEMLKDIGIKNVDKVMEAVNETRDKVRGLPRRSLRPLEPRGAAVCTTFACGVCGCGAARADAASPRVHGPVQRGPGRGGAPGRAGRPRGATRGQFNICILKWGTVKSKASGQRVPRQWAATRGRAEV